MAIKLILLDLDGTLLTSDKQISPANYAALERCAANGVHIVPSTGRFYGGMPQVVRDLPFVRYVVAVNGAQVCDLKEDKVLCREEIALDAALRAPLQCFVVRRGNLFVAGEQGAVQVQQNQFDCHIRIFPG